MNNAPRRCLIASRVPANVLGIGSSFGAGWSELKVHAARRTARVRAERLIVRTPSHRGTAPQNRERAFGSPRGMIVFGSCFRLAKTR